jgi:hypothetical protein
MGHQGVKRLKFAVDGYLIDTIDETCPICAKANIKRLPFSNQTDHRARIIIERIHCDICGPLPIGYNNFRYFILFIDDFSRLIYLYPLKSKSEASEKFRIFKMQVENLHNSRIKYFRTDNAGELTQGSMRALLDASGIIVEASSPESPQQNGVSERTNYTIASMVRAMLLDAQLHSWFWPFAAQHAVYLKNRTPHKALPPDKTPFELWTGRRPNLAHLQIFGSHCTAKIVNQHLAKFDPRGEHGRFLGFPPNTKGYLFWSSESRTVRVRHDLIFHNPPECR